MKIEILIKKDFGKHNHIKTNKIMSRHFSNQYQGIENR